MYIEGVVSSTMSIRMLTREIKRRKPRNLNNRLKRRFNKSKRRNSQGLNRKRIIIRSKRERKSDEN